MSRHCTRRLDALSARWGTPRHHIVQAIALIVLMRQDPDGTAHVHVGETYRGGVSLPPDLPLREAVRTVGDLAGDATAIVLTTPDGGPDVPERVRLEVAGPADGTLAVHSTCTERQAARLGTALRHEYRHSDLVRDVPVGCPADAADLRAWEQNLAPIPATTLDACFSRVARAVPDRAAVVAGAERLTYGRAEEQAGRLASLLLARGVQHGEPVVVVCDHPVRATVGQLAVLKAGGVCVPVGTATAEQARRTVALSRARHAVGGAPALGPWERHCRVLALEESERRKGAVPVDRALPRSGFTDIAHFLTGPAAERPAGVWLVAHDAWVSATVSRTHRAGGHPGEVTVCASPWELVCLSGMWWAFLSGGTLHWHDPNAPHAHRRAARHLTRAAGTVGLFTPEQYRRVLDSPGAASGGGPRTVVLTGEPCPPSLVERHFARTPAARLLGEFSADGGPLPWTASELGPADGEHTSPPHVGRTAPNIRVRVLDASGRTLPPGLPGELCAEGVALPWAVPVATGAARTETAPGGAGHLLRSGRLGRLRMDGSLELADGRIPVTAASHEPVARVPAHQTDT